MIFATGSENYPASPFNGWYMGTEIGARDLGDKDRYNQLPIIADRLGLDTRTDNNLWKDHALLTLNEAVLWSFNEDGVRIVDHHTASKEFSSFCDNEKKNLVSLVRIGHGLFPLCHLQRHLFFIIITK